MLLTFSFEGYQVETVDYTPWMEEDRFEDRIMSAFGISYEELYDGNLNFESIEDERYFEIQDDLVHAWNCMREYDGTEVAIEGLLDFINLCEEPNEEGIDYLVLFQQLTFELNILYCATGFICHEKKILPDVRCKTDLYKYKEQFRGNENKNFYYTCRLIHQQLQGTFTSVGYVY